MPQPDEKFVKQELAQASRLARELGDNFVRLVMITPATPEQQYRAYFVDSVGKIRCLRTPLQKLEKPSLFKRRVRSQLGYVARHITEHLPPFMVTPPWRAEVAQALAEGRRFVAEHAKDYSFVSNRHKGE